VKNIVAMEAQLVTRTLLNVILWRIL